MTRVVLDYKVQHPFWKHLFKYCVVRLGTQQELKQCQSQLQVLSRQIDDGHYSPSPIHGLLSAQKAAGVPRLIPVLQYRDYAVYFGCVKAFDDLLAKDHVPGTFGGWSLGGERRRREEAYAKSVFDDDYPASSSYNRFAWVKQWNEFWRLLAAMYQRSDEHSVFASLDVANFYDSIDLPRLERQLRSRCGEIGDVIEVLIYLLATWNKRINQYAPSTKGIPQDLVGDCSRILANFYLNSFDREFYAVCQLAGAEFMRYADDIVVRANNERSCRDLVFRAAIILNSLGLNINVSKVAYYTKASMNEHWRFDIMDSLRRFISAVWYQDVGPLLEQFGI